MVDISSRLDAIAEMISKGEYICINRARQFGKTTTIAMLRRYIEEKYIVISLDFQDLSKSDFQTTGTFVRAFCRLLKGKTRSGLVIPDHIYETINEYIGRTKSPAGMTDLFETLADWCAEEEKGIVLIIDEVDSASNNQIFLDFLSQLRSAYIKRDTENYPAFQSVILAGVTDIKHLRSKVRDDDQHKVNSPWNIAVDFDADMTLSTEGIKGMLTEYDREHGTAMDTGMLAQYIRDFTNGYPFLVSRICQIVDYNLIKKQGQDIGKAWSKDGIDEAIRMILIEKNTLFESLTGKLVNYQDIKAALHIVLMEGARIPYNPMQESISQMEMYGFIVNRNGTVAVSNRIFETVLYNLFLSDDELGTDVFGREGDLARNRFVRDNGLDVRLILEHFVQTYHEVYGQLTERFEEKDGRELFLLFLKPIINGTGNYYIEAQTRDQKRTDVIIDYLGKQYIIELKIWRGERYNEAGEKQIGEYLDYFGLNTGYMLSFNFNKKKETGIKRIQIGDKVLFEATV